MTGERSRTAGMWERDLFHSMSFDTPEFENYKA